MACAHSHTHTEYQAENANEHSYWTVCDDCGASLTGWGYSGWSGHSLSDGTCTDCGYSSHVHDYSYGYSVQDVYDTHHVMRYYCSCGDYVDYGEAHEGDPCIWCGYSSHTHDYSYSYSVQSSYDSYHVMRYYCSCGDYIEYNEAHEGNPCKWCGHEEAPPHSHSYDDWSYTDCTFTQHEITYRCSCGETYTTWDYHSFRDGVCTSCGYICTHDGHNPCGNCGQTIHTHNYNEWVIVDISGDTHTFAYICSCGDEDSSTRVTSPHDYSISTHKCIDCGHKCPHPSSSSRRTASPYASDPSLGHIYSTTCMDCLYVVHDNLEPHHFNSHGVCIDCGYDSLACAHDNCEHRYEPFDDKWCLEYTYCNDCHKELRGTGYSRTVAHEWRGDICVKCGYNKGCQHTDYEVCFEQIVGDAEKHRRYHLCHNCGQKFAFVEVPHNFDGDVCEDCGYDKNRKRPNYFYWHDVFITGERINVRASDWNALGENINEVREYLGANRTTITLVSAGDIIKASVYNELANILSLAPVSTNTIIKASHFNALSNAVNSIN